MNVNRRQCTAWGYCASLEGKGREMEKEDFFINKNYFGENTNRISDENFSD